MGTRPTYSSKEPFDGKRVPSDVLFDQIVSKCNVFNDSYTPGDSKQKKRQTRQKKKETAQKIVNQDEDTPTIFQFDDIPKFQKGKKKQLMTQPTPKKKRTINKKQTAASKIMKEIECEIPSSETPDTSLILNIESCSSAKQGPQAESIRGFKFHSKRGDRLSKPKREKLSKKSNKGYNLRTQAEKKIKRKQGKEEEMSFIAQDLTLDDMSSIEIPRDESVIPLSFLRKGSPLLFPLAQSNICDNSEDDLLTDEQEIDKMTWVSISSGPKDPHSVPDSSQYTFISTYTYGSSTAKSGSKVNTKSPSLFLHKTQNHLNSSVQKGKRNIKDMEFPEFISPIVSKRDKPLAEKKTIPNMSFPIAKEKKQRKCSTLLLESSSCQIPLDSLGLTAIPSRGTQPSEQRKQSSINFGSHKKTEKEQQSYKMRASTPKDNAVIVPVPLSISPVRMASWDEDELGFPVRDSIEVNTSEIIVPSLMQITEIPRKDMTSAEELQNSDLRPKLQNNGMQVCEISICSNQIPEAQPLMEENRSPSEAGPKRTRLPNTFEDERRNVPSNRNYSEEEREILYNESFLGDNENVEIKRNSGTGRNTEGSQKYCNNAGNASVDEAKTSGSSLAQSRHLSHIKVKKDGSKKYHSFYETRQVVSPTTTSPPAKPYIVEMAKLSNGTQSNLLENHSICEIVKESSQTHDVEIAQCHEFEIEHDEEDQFDMQPKNQSNKKTKCSRSKSKYTKQPIDDAHDMEMAECHEFEIEDDEKDHFDKQPKNQSNEKTKYSRSKPKCNKEPAGGAMKLKRKEKLAYSENCHLRLCFINRLCKQHRKTQKPKMVLGISPFSRSMGDFDLQKK